MKTKTWSDRPKRKFVKRVVTRYLPGDVTKDIRKKDLDYYNEHLKKVYNAKPRIDNTSPRLPSGSLFNPGKIYKSFQDAQKIHTLNSHMLMKINTINRTHGFVDCRYVPKIFKPPSNWRERELKQKQIVRTNQIINHRIQTKAANYKTKKFNSDWQKTLYQLAKRARYPLMILQKKTPDQLLAEMCSISRLPSTEQQSAIRVKIFMEFGIFGYLPFGKIIFELYTDILPKTCTHFLNRIDGGPNKTYKTYVNEYFTKIIPNEYCEIAPAKNSMNYGLRPIVLQENFLRHARPGVLSLVKIDNHSTSHLQFSITFAAYPKFDSGIQQRVVIGKVVKGFRVLTDMEKMLGKKFGIPSQKICIFSCGVVGGQRPPQLWEK